MTPEHEGKLLNGSNMNILWYLTPLGWYTNSIGQWCIQLYNQGGAELCSHDFLALRFFLSFFGG